ncbi:hypothetical protein DY000_02012751 [Brassica cretica]|uniref:Uncharacterized protein n=1 Tax=Brassica cretica TaxID=69181 RepID=A0ABQ7CTM0_BRACR|nr:hypothetical protein DY000_02012751 [Brassica cretica]
MGGIEGCCHKWRKTTTKGGRGKEDILGKSKEIKGGEEIKGGDGEEGEDGGGDKTTERGDATCGIFCSN